MHLKARSIADESIREALSLLENEVQQDNIRELAKRKWASIKGNTPFERNSKLIQFLLRKGFSYAEIKKELSAIEEWPEDFNHP
jgi:regulatory protein